MRIDLHVHSKHSKRPSQWFLQKLGCPESFTEPEKLYRIAKTRGMDMVTITDHNTLAGSLDIAHLPDTFVSEEITSYFPDNGCKVHILALHITERQHEDITHLRENVFELVPYLQEHNILHILAHALYGVNDRLTVGHFERMILLFKHFELNGTRDAEQNRTLRAVLENLTPEAIGRLVDKHGIVPAFDQPWIKHFTGGSDDHSSLGIASMHTEVAGARNRETFFDGLRAGRCRPRGVDATPKNMAHNLYSIAYQFYKSKFRLERYTEKDVFLKFVDRFLSGDLEERSGVIFKLQALWGGLKLGRGRPRSDGLADLFRHEAESLIYEDRALLDMARRGVARQSARPEEEWFRFATRVSGKVLSHFTTRLLDQLSGANLFDIFQGMGSAGALYTILGPYFVAYSLFTKERAFCRQVRAAMDADAGEPERPRRIKVGHFTDTFHEINGVAQTMRRNLAMAEKLGKDYTVVTCHPHEKSEMDRVKRFTPIGTYEFEEYPGQLLAYPPFLNMLAYVYEHNFTHLHSATPGPVGLAALAIARILKLPVHATYHTAFPQYAKHLTGDDGMEDMCWKYMEWYYNQMDVVFVPSAATGRELAGRGIRQEKIRLFPRGVDLARFDPAKRNGFLKKYDDFAGTNILYVGRISKEKNLHILAEAFRLVSAKHPNVRLVLTGNGPYADEMREALAGTRTLFTGYLEGEALAEMYACCDLFVFPSTTDTFGNVVLEAQASGLPVVVTDVGGPAEQVAERETGLIVREVSPERLAAALGELLAQPDEMARMGRAARLTMEGRGYEQAFIDTWEMYKRAS